jgi:hypothetical protein
VDYTRKQGQHGSRPSGNREYFVISSVAFAPWYVTNQALHDDLKVPYINDVIQEKSINHHDKLGRHSNPTLQPLLEQQQ